MIEGTGRKAKRMVLQCINGVSSNPVEGKTNIWQLKNLILTVWFNFQTYIYIYICRTQIEVKPLIDVQSSILSQIFTSQTSVPQIYVLFHILKLANSQIYVLTLTLTNKSAIDLKIWKGCRFENTLKSDRDLRYWCQWMPILNYP